ncbi:hypothetical protein N7462_001816, partial [Penicillium macrosclerotiorum]|uniref:uncharacterized protein n=1 Tax=Penicillium macrosclerotiorum TaxID=303699 RepID=UPI0025477C75
MLFFFDRLRRALYVLPEVYLEKGIFTPRLSLPIRINILQLRREKRELYTEIRSLAGTIKNTRISFPYKDIKKEIAKLRKRLLKTELHYYSFANRIDENINDEYYLVDRPKESPLPKEDNIKCATNVCIIYYGLSRQSSSSLPPHKFPSNRLDSLRRYLIDMHLEECRNIPYFSEITEFLAHTYAAHSYDINLKLYYLPYTTQTNYSDILSREESLESEKRPIIKTPASSVELELGNIDPRLLEDYPVPITNSLPYQSDTETLDSSGRFVLKNTKPSSVEVPIRRSTRGTAK